MPPVSKVAIIGAGFPALIMARELQNCAVDVTVYGKPSEAGVLSGMGPRYLWYNDATKDLLIEAEEPEIVDIWWYASGRLVDAHLLMRGDQIAYRFKSRGVPTDPSWQPCAGARDRLRIIPDGFNRLLTRLSVSTLKLVPDRVTGILGGGMIAANGTEVPVLFDKVLTTLPIRAFFALWPERYLYLDRAGVNLPAPSTIEYDFTQIAPMAGFKPKRQCMIYCGDEDVWWHRASWDGKQWCYESRAGWSGGLRPSDWTTTYKTKAATQLSDPAPPVLPYPDWVVPIGRFAEWNEELMVSDIYQRRALYLRQIIGYHGGQIVIENS